MADPRTPDEDDDIASSVTADIGGVQGGDEDAAATPAQTAPTTATPDAPAPDAGKIEWAGALIRKPPTPGG